jgi:hypothetical protein
MEEDSFEVYQTMACIFYGGFDRNQQHNSEILGTSGVGLSQGFYQETYQQIGLLC